MEGRCKGVVQYDLLFTNSTDSCDSPHNKGNVIALDSCHFTKKQTVSKLNDGRSLDCTICNSTANCVSLGIKEYEYFALWVIAKAKNYSSNSCIGRLYIDIVVLQPRSFQVTVTKRRQVTASWERPHEISYSVAWSDMTCVVMFSKRDGARKNCSKHRSYEQGNITTHTFDNRVMPWTEYSLTVCCAFSLNKLGEKKSSCTCGKPPYVIPSGTVSIRTLPEEPTEAPKLQPCKASCGERLNATLTWRANDKQVWNGFPVTSTITVRSIAQEKFDFPVINLSVPLPQDYSDSLVSYTIHNLAVEGTYRASVKFCSNGGCGPASEATVSCEQCLLINPVTPSAKYAVHSKSPKPSSWPGIALVCGFALVVFIVIISICWCRRNSEQPRENLPTLPELFNDEDVWPEIYDRIYGAANIDDDYHRIEGDDTRLLVPTGHSEEVV
ncbi:PREDICTED: uncharacterized protein LOC107349159 [Acropora digitifera]|uniref:uncharacterized protein LOC107349159 n=1 Tax=Acropora digitifera TaxID=70779 RepID=UPI00077AAD73|nr:PREDICTED: uncharacterized protein LOC107349159 [Acropora digitifera]